MTFRFTLDKSESLQGYRELRLGVGYGTVVGIVRRNKREKRWEGRNLLTDAAWSSGSFRNLRSSLERDIVNALKTATIDREGRP